MTADGRDRAESRAVELEEELERVVLGGGRVESDMAEDGLEREVGPLWVVAAC